MRQGILISFFIFIFALPSGLGQYVSGKIKTETGLPVPYASVFAPALHRGTTANEKGDFVLPLPPGSHVLSFQYLGLRTLKTTVEMHDVPIHLDVVLAQQEYLLPEVIVTSGGEDPAYFVMRKAIGMSQYYRNQLQFFKAKVYLKGSGMATHIPALLVKRFKKEGIEKGKTYVTETLSEIVYRKDEPLETKVLSMRSSLPGGDNEPMQFFTLSLYNDGHGAISPLSKDAMSVYRFHLEGTFVDDDHTVYKIRVIPKRKGSDLYDGSVFIREGSWSIHSAQLALSQKMVSVVLRQQYQQVQARVWMPVSHDYDVSASMLGIDFRFRYMASLSDVQVGLNPKLDHAFYAGLDEGTAPPTSTPEQSRVVRSEKRASENQQRINTLMSNNNLSNKEMRELNRLIKMESKENGGPPQLEIKQRSIIIDDSARLRSVTYWNKERTVPLSSDEANSFGEGDTLKITSADSLLQSLPFWLLMGGQPKKIGDRLHVTYNGLLGQDALEFNTVDGFTFMQSVNFRVDGNKKGFSNELSMKAGYAFARKAFIGRGTFLHHFAPMQRGMFEITALCQSADFNGDFPMLPAINSINSLMFKTNRAKYYDENAILASLNVDIMNGLETQSSVRYSLRNRLDNHSHYYVANFYNRNYTENIPDFTPFDSLLLCDTKALQLKAAIFYTPMQYYRVVKGVKQVSHSVWPTFGVALTATFADNNRQKAASQLLVISLRQSIGSRLWGKLDYEVEAGDFLGDKPLHFADWKHYCVSNTHVGPYAPLGSLRSAGNYERSTDGRFAAFRLAYSHSRILLKRLPFLAESLIRESVFAHQMMNSGQKTLTEIGYGIQQLFLVMNAEAFAAFEGGRFREAGIRIGIPFGMAIIEM